MLANRVRELTTTTGTGDLALAGALAGHIRFADAFSAGDSVTYVVEDGDNYEIGNGIFTLTGQIERTEVLETLVDGVYTADEATPIPLSGNARVFCAATSQFLLSATEEADLIREATTDAGVTVDGVLIKDGGATFANKVAVTGNIDADRVLLNAGSAASPTHTFAGNLSTGAYTPGAGQYGISTGGVEALLLDAVQNATLTGRVGAGGPPISAWFEARGGGAGFEQYSGGGNRTFSVGTSSNSGLLRVYDSVGAEFFRTDANTGYTSVGNLEAGNQYGVVRIKADSLGHAICIEEPSGGGENYQIGVDGSGNLGFFNSGASDATLLLADDDTAIFSGQGTFTDALTVVGNDSATVIIGNTSGPESGSMLRLDGWNGSSAVPAARLVGLSDGGLKLNTNGTGTALTIDANQNATFMVDVAVDGDVAVSGAMRVGGTPRTDWGGAYGVIEIGANGALMSGTTNDNLFLGNNWYWDGSYKYRDTGYAAQYLFSGSGKHIFRTASENTTATGAPLTWTDALTINSDATADFAGDVTLSRADAVLNVGTTRGEVGIGVNAIRDDGTNMLFDAVRPAAFNNDLKVVTGTGVDNKFSLQRGVTEVAALEGVFDGFTLNAHQVARISTGGTTALTIDVNQNAIFTGAVQLGDTGTTQPILSRNAGGGLLISANGAVSSANYLLQVSEDGLDRFTIDGSGAATIAGGVTVETTDASQLNLTRTGVGTYTLGVVSGDALAIFDDGVEKFRVDSAGDAQIAGRVDAAGVEVSKRVTVRSVNDLWFEFSRDGSESGNYGTFKKVDGTSTLGFLGGGGGAALSAPATVDDLALRAEADLYLAAGGNNATLRLHADQSATFAGDVYIGEDKGLYIQGSTNAFCGVIPDTDINLMLGTGSGSEPRVYLYGSANGQGTAGNVFIGTADNSGIIQLFGQVETNGNIELGGDRIVRSVDTDDFTISGGTEAAVGSNLVLYGPDNPSVPNDLLFRAGTKPLLRWDDSANEWNFQSNRIAAVADITRGTSASQLRLAGGSTAAMGGNIVLYSESHTTNPSDIVFRSNGLWVSSFDASANTWNYHGRDVTGFGDVDISGTLESGRVWAGGLAVQDHYLHSIGGTVNSTGSNSVAAGLAVRPDVIGAAGDTSWLSHAVMGAGVGGSVTTQGESETISLVSTLYLSDPNITVGTGDTINNAATLYIQGAPSEATNNYGIMVAGGAASKFGGDVEILGNLLAGGSPQLHGNVSNSSALIASGSGDEASTGLLELQGYRTSSDVGRLGVVSFHNHNSTDTANYKVAAKLEGWSTGANTEAGQLRGYVHDGTDLQEVIQASATLFRTHTNAQIGGYISVGGGTSGQLRIVNSGAATAGQWWFQVRNNADFQIRHDQSGRDPLEIKADTGRVNVNNGLKVSDVLILEGLPTYDSEALAATGGLSTDQVYKTSSGELRIKL